MGTKQRHFAPLINMSLEALVPQGHFYRHLERTLDLSFVREFVRETYAAGGPLFVSLSTAVINLLSEVGSQHLKS
jgi:hypothetical protein